MTMPEPWWSCAGLPGRQRKSGSSDSATFMRKVPEPGLDAREAPAQFRLDGAFRHQVAEQQLGPDIGRDGARRDALAGLEAHAGRLPAFNDQAGDAGAGADAALRAPRPSVPWPG